MSTAFNYLRIAIWVPWATIGDLVTLVLLLAINLCLLSLLVWFGYRVIQSCVELIKRLCHLLTRTRTDDPRETPAIPETAPPSTPAFAREQPEEQTASADRTMITAETREKEQTLEGKVKEAEDTKEEPAILVTPGATGTASTPKILHTPEPSMISETPAEQSRRRNRQMPPRQEAKTGMDRREVEGWVKVTSKETDYPGI